MIYYILIWLAGSWLGFILIKLDFKKSIIDVYGGKFNWQSYLAFGVASLLFSWVLVLTGLVINGIKGNFSKYR